MDGDSSCPGSVLCPLAGTMCLVVSLTDFHGVWACFHVEKYKLAKPREMFWKYEFILNTLVMKLDGFASGSGLTPRACASTIMCSANGKCTLENSPCESGDSF